MPSASARSTGSDFHDNALFASVVMPHIDAAYRLAQWLTGNPTDAEDAVQASVPSVDLPASSARAWVLSIVRNTAYSWLRKNRAGVIVSVEDLEPVEAAQSNLGQPNATTPDAAIIVSDDRAQYDDR